MKLDLKRFESTLPPLREGEGELYEKYFEVLQSWNERMALVSKKSIEFAVANHFADSLFIADFGLKSLASGQAYDLGSGAGFPGLVVAIRNPDLPVTLFEKLLKKQTFLFAAVEHLGLKNVSIQGSMPEQPIEGVLFARAVMPPPELFPFVKPRLKPDSVFILNIGSQTAEPAAPTGFERVDYTRYTLPLDAGDRQCIAYRRVSST